MSSVVYPLDVTKDIYDIIKSSFSKKKFVKINTLKDNSCIYDSFLLNVYKNYQEEQDKVILRKMRENFIVEFKGYLTSDSNMSNQFIFDKVFEAFRMSDMKDMYVLKSSEDTLSIFDLVILKKDFSENENKVKGYRLFPERTKKYFSDVSNFFNLISLEFLKEIIEQRIIRKAKVDKIKKLRLSEGNKKQIEELEEILDFMNRKENNLDIVSLYESVTLEDCEDQDLVLRLISETLDINIFLCRGWNKEISVLKDFHKDDISPYIIIFKGDGKVSLTGKNSRKNYEAGGIKTKDGIKTLLTREDEDIITDIKKIYQNDVESYFLEKYNKYLKNIEQKSKLDNLDNYYDETSGEEEEELEEKIEEEIEELEEKIEIPGFIRGYSKSELEKLLNLFVNPEYDYSTTEKRDLEIQYKNYLENTERDD